MSSQHRKTARGHVTFLVASLSASAATADGHPKNRARPPDLSAIQSGDSWFCYKVSREDIGWSSSGCYRGYDECSAQAATYSGFEDVRYTVSACREQPKVAVYTYYKVLEDVVKYQARSTFADCKESRAATMGMDPNDVKSISRCAAVGRIRSRPAH